MSEVILLSVLLVGLAMGLLAIGILFGRPCLRGSCGGLAVLDRDGEPLSCATCPHRRSDSGADPQDAAHQPRGAG